jgi:hypothetical protein
MNVGGFDRPPSGEYNFYMAILSDVVSLLFTGTRLVITNKLALTRDRRLYDQAL